MDLEFFLERHLHLKTRMLKAIELTRVKDVMKDQVLAFNQEFYHVIHKNDI